MKLLSGRKRLQPHPAFAPFLRQVEALAQLLRSQTETEREEGRFWAAEAENRPYFAPLGSDRFRNVYFALPPDFRRRRRSQSPADDGIRGKFDETPAAGTIA